MVLIKKFSFTFILFLLLGLNCCTKQASFTSYRSLGSEGMSAKPYVFELNDLSIDNTPQNLFIRLRNDNSYPFTNIFLICTLKSGENIVLEDTLEYTMAAPDGSWLGKGFTEVKESKLWWKEGVVFPREKPVVVEISQAMRNNGSAEGISSLKGIVSVGLSIEAQNQ